MAIQIVLLTAIYYITGKLGLLLALPPGYASLVWPAFGVAIAGLLIFGINRWPGVFLGAFLVNLKSFTTLTSYAIAAGIGIGNTCGVIAAALFVKKILAFPKAVYTEKDVFIFLLLTGPFAALISSTMGVSILLLLNEIHQRNAEINWLYWYIGDATGGIIFTPLAMFISLQSRKYWLKSTTKVLIPLIVFFGLIIASLHYVQKVEKEKMIADFTSKSKIALGILERSLSTYQVQADILRNFFENSEEVTAKEFELFAHGLLVNRPEIQSFVWVPLLSPQTQEYKVHYISPLELNKHVKGVNLYLEPQYKSLIEKTIQNGHDVHSEELNYDLLGLSEPHVLFSVYTTRPSGVLIEAIRIPGIIEQFKDFINNPSYRIIVEKIIQNGEPQLIIDSHQLKNHSHFNITSEFTWSTLVNVADNHWRISFYQDPTTGNSAPFSAQIFLLIPLVFTFLTCALLLIIFTRVITIESIVKEKTHDLQVLNAKLEKASKTKSEFLANMSHEIRTPLNVLIGMSDLLEDSHLTSEQKHYVDISRKAGDSLLTIINDILDISKIESGLITLEKAEIHIPQLVRDVAEMFSVKCREKKLTLSTEISPELEQVYLGDPTRIRQILANLISNSIKFTQQGGLKIKVTPNFNITRAGNIYFEIADTGIGIPPEKMPLLFKPFTQADTTITRKYGGTGLGLSISKRLTEMMNGTIAVESDIHHGSTFSFTLDLPVAPMTTSTLAMAPVVARPSQNEQSQQSPHLKILIVDDTEDNRTLIRAFLKNTSHELFEANDGEKALALFKANHPDLILMDMQMPIMDGFTATKAIRQWEKDQQLKPIQIWALTAYALNTEITKSLEAGCNLHLVKPIRRQELVSRIEELAKQNTP